MKFQSYIKELENVDFPVTYVFIEEKINRLRPNSFGVIETIDILWMVNKMQTKESTKLLIQRILKCYEFLCNEKYEGVNEIQKQISSIIDELICPPEETIKLTFRRSITKKNLSKPLIKLAQKLRISFHLLELQWVNQFESKIQLKWICGVLNKLQNYLNQERLQLVKKNQQNIICRICEKEVSVNMMISHCNKCEQQAESKRRLLELNLELADVSELAFKEKRNIQVKQAIKNMKTKTQKKIVMNTSKLRRTQTHNYDEENQSEEIQNDQELVNVNNAMTIVINYSEKVLKGQTEDTKQNLVVMNELVNAINYIESSEASTIVNRAHKCILERMDYQKKQELLRIADQESQKDSEQSKIMQARRQFTKSNSISFRLHKFQASPSPRIKPNDEPIFEDPDERSPMLNLNSPSLKRREFKMNTSIFKVSDGSDSPRSPFQVLQRTKTVSFQEDFPPVTPQPLLMQDSVIEQQQEIRSPSIKENDGSIKSHNSSDSIQKEISFGKIKQIKRKSNFHSQEIIKAPSHPNQKKSKFCNKFQQPEEEELTKTQQEIHIEQTETTYTSLNDVLQIEKGYHSDSSVIKTSPILQDEQVGLKDFEFIRPLGKGAYGWVFLVRKKGSGDLYALKIIDCNTKNLESVMEQLKAERNIFEILNSNFVVKAFFSFVHEHYLCFVQEYMVGGDLAQILKTYTVLDEIYVRHYMAEIVLALEYLRNQNIIHRDLKPENILLDSQGHAKLADFGLSEKGVSSRLRRSESVGNAIELELPHCIENMSPNQSQYQTVYNLQKKSNESFQFTDRTNGRTKKIVGTPDYIAPEILRGISIDNYSADYWSLGVIMYEMLCGIAPFNDDSVEKIFANILNYRIEWPPIGEGEDCLSPLAFDLIIKLLEPDHLKRIGQNSIQEIKLHKFFNGIEWHTLLFKPGLIIPEISDTKNDTEKIEQFLNKLKKPEHENGNKKLTQQLKAQLQNLERVDLLKQTSVNQAEQVLASIVQEQATKQRQMEHLQHLQSKLLIQL